MEVLQVIVHEIFKWHFKWQKSWKRTKNINYKEQNIFAGRFFSSWDTKEALSTQEKHKINNSCIEMWPWQKKTQKRQDPCLTFRKQNLHLTCLRHLERGNQDILSSWLQCLDISRIQRIQTNVALRRLMTEIKAVMPVLRFYEKMTLNQAIHNNFLLFS